MVDLGSNINLIGCNTKEDFVRASMKAGLETAYVQRPGRLHVKGVGTGSAPCDQEAVIPIAVKFSDRPATQESFRANVAEGVGSDLPAIPGATSMRKKDSVIVLREGKECIAFPGPGGYKIEWSPGTRLLPMTYSLSGHMVI